MLPGNPNPDDRPPADPWYDPHGDGAAGSPYPAADTTAPMPRIDRVPAGAHLGAGGAQPPPGGARAMRGEALALCGGVRAPYDADQAAGRARRTFAGSPGTWPTWAILAVIALVGVGLTCGGVGLIQLVGDDPPATRDAAAAQPATVPSAQSVPPLPTAEEDSSRPAERATTTGRPSTGTPRATATTPIVVIGQRCAREGLRARTANNIQVRCERGRNRRLTWQPVDD